MDKLDQPVVILVTPQMGENIGMAARAMLNCGLTRLRLVSPRDGWPSEPARNASSGAHEVIDGVEVFDTTADAIADLSFVYATSGRERDLVQRILTPRKAASEMRERIASGGNVGILFGGERAGLTNEDVSLSDTVIRVPLNPDFKSLNIAQAVLLVAYEWFTSDDETPVEVMEMNNSELATKEQLLNFMDHLERGIDAGGYIRNEDMRPTMIRNLRAIFQRANLTQQEVRSLHGVIKALQRLRGKPLGYVLKPEEIKDDD